MLLDLERNTIKGLNVEILILIIIFYRLIAITGSIIHYLKLSDIILTNILKY